MSLLNGALIGLALAVGAWGGQMIALLRLPLGVPAALFPLVTLALVLIGAVAGGLTAAFNRSWAGALVWALAGYAMVWIIGHTPYEIQSRLIGLLDRRFAGLDIFPYHPAAQARLFVAGFFTLIVLIVLGLIQDYRLDGITGEMGPNGRLQPRGWFLLLAPLPVVLTVGLIADHNVQRPWRMAPAMVDDAIRVGRTHPGDLFDLSRETGFNYNAVKGLTQAMSERYVLHMAEIEAHAVEVTARFDNGYAINCRVLLDPPQLSFCYPADKPYREGLALLLAGESSQQCMGCLIRTTTEWETWLAAQGRRLGSKPTITLERQWGGHVFVRVTAADESAAIACLFGGVNPVTLVRCEAMR
ncbi:MAG: hypothetical protein N2383_02105 [Caldilineales bacterium]|nr:hypothetical protein [Caldilineales bacterium]